MGAVVIAVCIVVVVMTVVMFLVLKGMVKTISEQLKTYFIDKLQSYDELIDIKEAQLNDLNKRLEAISIDESEKIENKEQSINLSFLYDINTPSYRDNNLFKNYKKINEQFDMNINDVVKKFIKDNVIEESTEYYDMLSALSSRLDNDYIYKLLTMRNNEQLSAFKNTLDTKEIKVLNEYLGSEKEFNILKFVSYVNDLVIKNDPTIYIRVGNKEANFNHLNKFIKTEYTENICVGVMIVYKNKLYDYSLSQEGIAL